MRRTVSPHLRLLLLLPALAALVVAGALLWNILPGLLQQTAAAQLRNTLSILVPQVAVSVEAPPEELQATLHRLVDGTSLRITVIAEDGRVLGDSSQTVAGVARMDDHGDRPEVREALAAGSGSSVRTSATTGRTYVYAATAVTDTRGRTRVLRVAEPLVELDELRARLGRGLLLAGFAALLAMVALAWWLDRRFLRPLSDLIGRVRRSADGEAAPPPTGTPPGEELAELSAALDRLAERHRDELAAATDRSQYLERVIARLSEGVMVTDTAGRVEMANPAFRRLFGISGELVGRTPLEITRQAGLARMIRETLASGRAQHDELTLAGSPRRVVSLATERLSGGRGVVVEARDKTGEVRLGEMRRDLVANVSHELKTPLSAIRGFAETLAGGALADRDRARDYVGRILVQCSRLQALLEDLLILSRLESPEAVSSRHPLDLAALARRVVELVSNLAARKEITVELDVEPLPPFSGDKEALERLLLNLLENAVKYNRPGGRVDVRLAADGDAVVLEVSDTGIGIPQVSLDRVFERFYRVDRGRARDDGGTGLGLAIVKHAAQIHGGRVEAESRPGHGSTFRVLLPLGEPRES